MVGWIAVLSEIALAELLGVGVGKLGDVQVVVENVDVDVVATVCKDD